MAAAQLHDAQGRLPDALQLQVEEPLGAFCGELTRLAHPLTIRHQRSTLAGATILDDDEAPGLRLTDTGAAMARIEHLAHQLVRHGVGTEAANIAAGTDHPVEGRLGGLVEGPTTHITVALVDR